MFNVILLVLAIVFVLLTLHISNLPALNKTEGMCDIKYPSGGHCSKNTLYYFQNRHAANKYYDLYIEFGTPTLTSDEPGGLVIWRGADYFEEITLKDEGIEHLDPESHCDFLYATVKVHVPEELLQKVLMLSKSIFYDRLKQELTARCASMSAVVATLWVAMNIIRNPTTTGKLYEEYPKAIKASVDKYNYKKIYTELKDMILENQTIFRNFLPNRKCVFTTI